jgi:hypothetical protein
MAKGEAALPADERIDFVSIVTPNFLHAPVATTFLKKGFHVVCDKPMTLTLEGGEGAARNRAQDRKGFCAHAQLHRLSDGEGGARTRPQRQARENPESRRRISARLAARPIEAEGQKQARGAAIRKRPARAAASATSARTRKILAATSPAWRLIRSARSSRRSFPAANWRTMRTC